MNHELVTIAAKFLKPVEINAFQSNQHEFHGVSAFKHVFGTGRLETKPLTYHIDYEYNVVKSTSNVTWYDAEKPILIEVNTDYTIKITISSINWK